MFNEDLNHFDIDHYCTRKLARFEPKQSEMGFTLIELLVSLVLGLFLLIGVISLLTETRRSYRVNDNLARMQENARFGFEALSREIREAGSTPCGMRQAMASVVQQGGVTPWYAKWDDGTLQGFDGLEASSMAPFGTLPGTRVSGTDAVLSLRNLSNESSTRIVTAHTTADSTFTTQADPATAYSEADLITVCDSKSGVILQVGSISTPLKLIEYGTAFDNCSLHFVYQAGVACPPDPPPLLPAPPVNRKAFAVGAVVTRYDPAFWYIGNSASGRSLYRLNVISKAVAGGTIRSFLNRQELIPSVSDLQVEYLTRNGSVTPPLATSFVTAAAGTLSAVNGRWTEANLNQVVAVRITLTLLSDEKVSTTNTPLERKIVSVVSIRSRDVAN